MTSAVDRDRERVWELHTSSEFSTLDLDMTMATMSDAPEVVHVPTAMGARGRASVRHFYRRWFVGHNAPDFAIEPLTRTTGGTRLVDEMLVSFTHDVEVPWILPGVPPTGRRVEIPLIAVVSFDGALVSAEHLYWDQAAVLGQTGLLPAETMARLPVVTDQRGTPADGPLNQLAGGGRRT
ncbi:nuclear transport factor 2 family protein [Streptomyces sp. NPDC054786]